MPHFFYLCVPQPNRSSPWLSSKNYFPALVMSPITCPLLYQFLVSVYLCLFPSASVISLLIAMAITSTRYSTRGETDHLVPVNQQIYFVASTWHYLSVLQSSNILYSVSQYSMFQPSVLDNPSVLELRQQYFSRINETDLLSVPQRYE